MTAFPGTFGAGDAFPHMNQMTTDLRAAAASARAFADNAGSTELRLSFYKMARRWEAEADRREKEQAEMPGNFHPLVGFSLRGAGRG